MYKSPYCRHLWYSRSLFETNSIGSKQAKRKQKHIMETTKRAKRMPDTTVKTTKYLTIFYLIFLQTGRATDDLNPTNDDDDTDTGDEEDSDEDVADASDDAIVANDDE